MATKKRRKPSRRKRRSVSGNPSLSPSVIGGTGKRKKKRRSVGKVRKRRKGKKMGAITGSDTGDMLIGTLLGFGVGIGAKMLTDKQFPGKGKYIEPAKAILGAVIAIKAKKNKIIQGGGIGLAIAGAYGSAKEFGVISGMEEFMHGIGAGKNDEMLIEMNGVDYNSTRFLSGSNEEQPSVVAGDDDGMSGEDDGMSGDDDGMSGRGRSRRQARRNPPPPVEDDGGISGSTMPSVVG